MTGDETGDADRRWKWIFTKIRCYGIIQGTVLGLLMREAEIWEKI